MIDDEDSKIGNTVVLSYDEYHEVTRVKYCDIDLIVEKVDDVFNNKLMLTDKGTITCTNGTIQVNDENYNLLIRDARDVMNELITNYIMLYRVSNEFYKNPGVNYIKKNKKGEDVYDMKKVKSQFCIYDIFERYINKYLSLQANRIETFLIELEFFADNLHNYAITYVECADLYDTSRNDRIYTYLKHLFSFQIESYNLEFDNRDDIMKMIDTIRYNLFENKKYKLDVKSKMYGKIVKILKTMCQISIDENQMICEFVQDNSKRFIEHQFNTYPCFILELYKFFGKLRTCIIDNFCKKSELLKVYDMSENIEPF